MKYSDVNELAAAIAAELFTDGTGERATRLLHQNAEGVLGGGWCEQGASRQIADTIVRWFNDQAEKERPQKPNCVPGADSESARPAPRRSR